MICGLFNFIAMKTCTRCNKKLPLSQYHKNSTSSDGLLSICKTCKSNKMKQYWNKNKESLKLKRLLS